MVKISKNSNNAEGITCFDSLDKNEIKKKKKIKILLKFMNNIASES